jgi:hypothetical protein
MIDINKLISDLNKAIEEGRVYVGYEANGHKPATDAKWARMLGTTHGSVIIEAGPKGKDTQDERNSPHR